MQRQTRRFQRPRGERRYKRLFVIATEGNKTEKQYFGTLNRLASSSHVAYVPGGHASVMSYI